MSNEQFSFKRAQRSQARLRLAIAAVSGAGKTMGSLRLAKGIVECLIDTGQIEGPIEGKIAMIDTERKSASLYSHVVPFDTLELEPPYSVDRYQQALMAAERAGYIVCIIDQISHAWAGPGGQLEWIDTLKASSKNAISPWAKITPVQQEFYDRMLRSPMHIIATMRAKSEWVLEEQILDGGRKKIVPRKIGLSPVQREGIEYEFTTCLDVDLDSHMATASKDRTSMFMDRSTRLDEACGRMLAEWLVSGKAVELAPDPKPPVTGAGASAGSGAGEDGDREAAELRAANLQRLEDATTDFELKFLECETLPDLAALFDGGQKEIRSFVKVLGAPVVKPFLDRVIKAKDECKTRLAKPPAGDGERLRAEAQAQLDAKAATKPTEATPADLLGADQLVTADDAKAAA